MAAFSAAWGRPSGGGFIANPKASEPLSSRAEDYKSPGDNTSPAGRAIPTGIGASSYEGSVVWQGGFKVINGRVTFSCVMMFADCALSPSFDLVKMLADEKTIISNIAPLKQSSQKIRFYDGTQTTPDSYLVTRIGEAEATAWPGFCYAVFEDFDCTDYGSRMPLIRAVLGSSVTEATAVETQSTLSFGAFDPALENHAFAVDRIRGQHIQIVRDDSGAYISIIDIASAVEVHRVAMESPMAFGFDVDPVALEGSDYIACKTLDGSDSVFSVVSTITGETAATINVGGLVAYPKMAVPIESGARTRYLVFCARDSGGLGVSSLFVALVDVTALTAEWIIHPTTNPFFTGEGLVDPGSIAFGPIQSGQVTFFTTEKSGGIALPKVRRAVVSASGLTQSVFYTETDSSKDPTGVAYDSTDNTVVIYREDGSFLKKTLTGATVYETAAQAVTNLAINTGNDRLSHGFVYRARPGFVIAANDLTEIYEIKLSDGSLRLLIDLDNFSHDDSYVYFDQLTSTLTEGSLTPGIINKIVLGDATPDTVDLVDIFAQLATFDDKFDVLDLAFSGFPGAECKGLKLENDTTIDDLEQSIADAFDVKIIESDGTRKYKYPPRDGSFAVDATIAASQFIENGTQTIEKQTASGEDEFVGCAVSYFDVDADFEKLEQSYQRPVGVFDVTRSKKKRTINTVLSMTASQAMRAATLATFRSVLGNESYSFGLTPPLAHLEPGDIVQFDFRGFTTVARIKEATLDADYTQECLAYQYLQYSDATYNGVNLTPTEEVQYSLFPRLVYLDTPLLSYAHDLGGEGLVQYAQMAGYGDAALSYALLYQSRDGTTFTKIRELSQASPVVGVITAISGTPTEPLDLSDASTPIDTTNTLTVAIGSGSAGDLESVTEAEMLAGANMAAIGRSGRWVIIHYQDVSASGSQATLSNIMWGVLGSEVWINSLAIGDLFVPLNPEHYSRFRSAVADLNGTFYYKAADATVSLGSVATQAHVATGVAEKPYACVNLDAVLDGSDIIISWDYRSRLASGLNPTNHGEASLSFEIDIVDGTTVKRTLTATANSVTYTAAQISSDFGSSPGNLKFRVYMMSAVVGRGYAAEVTTTLGFLLLESGDNLLLETGDQFRLE